jgi:hypothetical protein
MSLGSQWTAHTKLVHYRQNSSFHHPMKAEQSTHSLHPCSVPSLSKPASGLPHLASTSSSEGSILGGLWCTRSSFSHLIPHLLNLLLPLEQQNLDSCPKPLTLVLGQCLHHNRPSTVTGSFSKSCCECGSLGGLGSVELEIELQ